MPKVLAPLALLLLALASPVFTAPPVDATGVDETFRRCIGAMTRLELEVFSGCFDADITLFNPDIREAPNLHRLAGRAAVEANFGKVFEHARRSASGPVYLHVEPRDVLIQMNGDTAVVTFEFDRDAGSYGRRTIVLVRRANGWKILHIHASNVPGPRATP
jgi:hypothetical protein